MSKPDFTDGQPPGVPPSEGPRVPQAKAPVLIERTQLGDKPKAGKKTLVADPVSALRPEDFASLRAIYTGRVSSSTSPEPQVVAPGVGPDEPKRERLVSAEGTEGKEGAQTYIAEPQGPPVAFHSEASYPSEPDTDPQPTQVLKREADVNSAPVFFSSDHGVHIPAINAVVPLQFIDMQTGVEEALSVDETREAMGAVSSSTRKAIEDSAIPVAEPAPPDGERRAQETAAEVVIQPERGWQEPQIVFLEEKPQEAIDPRQVTGPEGVREDKIPAGTAQSPRAEHAIDSSDQQERTIPDKPNPIMDYVLASVEDPTEAQAVIADEDTFTDALITVVERDGVGELISDEGVRLRVYGLKGHPGLVLKILEAQNVDDPDTEWVKIEHEHESVEESLGRFVPPTVFIISDRSLGEEQRDDSSSGQTYLMVQKLLTGEEYHSDMEPRDVTPPLRGELIAYINAYEKMRRDKHISLEGMPIMINYTDNTVQVIDTNHLETFSFEDIESVDYQSFLEHFDVPLASIETTDDILVTLTSVPEFEHLAGADYYTVLESLNTYNAYRSMRSYGENFNRVFILLNRTARWFPPEGYASFSAYELMSKFGITDEELAEARDKEERASSSSAHPERAQTTVSTPGSTEGSSSGGGEGSGDDKEGREHEGPSRLIVKSPAELRKDLSEVAEQAKQGAHVVITHNGEPAYTGKGIADEDAEERFRSAFGGRTEIKNSELIINYMDIEGRAVAGETFMSTRFGIPYCTFQVEETTQRALDDNIFDSRDIRRTPSLLFELMEQGEKVAIEIERGKLLRFEAVSKEKLIEAYGGLPIFVSDLLHMKRNAAEIRARAKQGERLTLLSRKGKPLLWLDSIDSEKMYEDEYGTKNHLTTGEFYQQRAGAIRRLSDGQKLLLTNNGEVVGTFTRFGDPRIQEMYANHLDSDAILPLGDLHSSSSRIANAAPGEIFTVTDYNIPAFTVRILSADESNRMRDEGIDPESTVSATQLTRAARTIAERVKEGQTLVGMLGAFPNIPDILIQGITEERRKEMLLETFGMDSVVSHDELRRASAIKNLRKGQRMLFAYKGKIIAVIDGVTKEQREDMYLRQLFGEEGPGDTPEPPESPDDHGGPGGTGGGSPDRPDQGAGPSRTGNPDVSLDAEQQDGTTISVAEFREQPPSEP